MPHPNLKSQYPVSPTLGGGAASLLEFINMPSSPESEGTKDDNSVTTGFISPDDLPGQQNVHGPTRSPSTSIPQLESGHNKPQVINAPQRAVVEQRASLFGPTVVKGCRSVESLRKRVARMPSLDSLPENGTERACPEIEIEGMNQGIPDEEHSAMLLMIPEISRIVEPLSMPELRHMSIMLHQRYGRVVSPVDLASVSVANQGNRRLPLMKYQMRKDLRPSSGKRCGTRHLLKLNEANVPSGIRSYRV
jgi:hypothetical protein